MQVLKQQSQEGRRLAHDRRELGSASFADARSGLPASLLKLNATFMAKFLNNLAGGGVSAMMSSLVNFSTSSAVCSGASWTRASKNSSAAFVSLYTNRLRMEGSRVENISPSDCAACRRLSFANSARKLSVDVWRRFKICPW